MAGSTSASLHSDLQVGQPVSGGLSILRGKRLSDPVRGQRRSRSAVDAAWTTSRLKPKPVPIPSAARTTTADPAVEVIYGADPYGGGVVKRHDRKAEAEDKALRRRIEWAERHRGRADFELILTNLGAECGYESGLLRGR